MKQDFFATDADRLEWVEIYVDCGGEIVQVKNDATALASFITLNVQELGLNDKQQGRWFRLTVMFQDPKDAMWMKLKWL